MKKFLKVLTLVIVVSFVLAGCNGYFNEVTPSSSKTPTPSQTESEDETPVPSPTPEPDIRTVNMVAVGNIFPHMPQIDQAYIGDGNYDFSPSFEFITPRLQQADFVVADLEASQAGPEISFIGYQGYTAWPTFNPPQALSENLRDAGVDIMTLANNHAMDRGYNGLMITIDYIRSLGIKTFGAYKSQEERDTILIENYDGINIAFIGYTFSTNGVPLLEGHEYSVNLVPFFEDYSPLIADIEKAKELGADIIAVFPHWGNEHNSEPNPQSLRNVASDIAKAGADIIIGGHPKYTQPLEWFFNEDENGDERATVAIYAQGNFLSNQHYPALPSYFVEYHALLDVDFTKNMNTGEAYVSDVNYEITWIHRDWRHRILPLKDVFEATPSEYNLSQAQYDQLKMWNDNVIESLETYGFSENKQRALDLNPKD